MYARIAPREGKLAFLETYKMFLKISYILDFLEKKVCVDERSSKIRGNCGNNVLEKLSLKTRTVFQCGSRLPHLP